MLSVRFFSKRQRTCDSAGNDTLQILFPAHSSLMTPRATPAAGKERRNRRRGISERYPDQGEQFAFRVSPDVHTNPSATPSSIDDLTSFRTPLAEADVQGHQLAIR